MPRANERLVLRARVHPGDLLMLTGALRDLHIAHPGRYLTDVDTTCRQIWDGNPYVSEVDRVETHRYINLGYPRYSHGELNPPHLSTRYHGQLAEELGVDVPVTRACPEIYLSEADKDPNYPRSIGLRKPYWVIMAGAKYDTTTKWWNPAYYQEVVDRLEGKIDLVQCGSAGGWHPPLQGVVNLVGRTDIREFIRLIHHADGVLCPVTFAAHLAAAVPTPSGVPRACVVIVGGRETPSLIQYPNHTLLHLVGKLDCCIDKGCWRYVCQETDASQHRLSRCVRPIEISPDLKLPQCMQMIGPDRVVEAILNYYPDATRLRDPADWSAHGNGKKSLAAARAPMAFGYTHPRHLQEHYQRAGGQNVLGRCVRSARDLDRVLAKGERIDLLIVGNHMDGAAELVAVCEKRGIDRVYGEFGWFPHYSTIHADPLGYGWNSSLCTTPFIRLTASQRAKADEFRHSIRARPFGPLPKGVRPPYVLWPLQLLEDRMNRHDLAAADWYDLLLWTRQSLPAGTQLVIKPHPVVSEQARLGHVAYFPNTIVVDRKAPLYPLIEHAEGVIGLNSTVLLEARLLFDKPTWAFGRGWHTGHPDLIFPMVLGESLPHDAALGEPLADSYACAYRSWFIWHLLARQFPASEACEDPPRFLNWLHRRTAHAYAALGEDAFRPTPAPRIQVPGRVITETSRSTPASEVAHGRQ